MGKTTPEHTPALDHGAAPWILLVALATMAPHAAHLPTWLTGLAGGVLALRLWLWRGERRLPARWLLVLLVSAGSIGIAIEYRTLFGRDAGVALLTLFMALKTLETRDRRDALVIVMLGYFLLLTHYFYFDGIPSGIWLLAVCGLLTATLIRLYGGPQPLRSIIRHAALLLTQAVPFMLILFLLFPRISGPLWGLPQDAHAGQSGLSDDMSPGSLNKLILSGGIAFRVEFAGKVPENSTLYWRGPVFDDYDGLTWRAARDPAHFEQRPEIETNEAHIDYVSTLEAHNQRWLLALDLPVSLPPDARLSANFETLRREPVRQRIRVAFSSVLSYRANATESVSRLEHALRLPPGMNPRARALAAGWRGLPPEGITDKALELFRREAFFYTLRPPLLGQHAMDEFLFETRRGFCEHYASAFVFLMRSAGVPARVVAGYQGGEINPIDGFLTIRQSDAHAWAEVWIAERGWVRVDPTAAVAPSRVERGIAAALPASEPLPVFSRLDTDWLRGIRNRWEAANNAWNQWVLGYNPQRQLEVLSRLGLGQIDWRGMVTLLALLCGAVVLIISAWALYRRRATDPAQHAWLRFCQRLQEFGVRRADWEGPADFAARVARELPELGPLATEAAHLYASLRYGNGKQENLKQLQACAKRLPIRWRRPT